MTEAVFERYKEALKQGHVATYRGRPKEALAHYQEAAKLAGHRALPFINIGSVLLQQGRAQEACSAYDEALRRAPDDRQALSGKAAALLAAGKRTDAAAILKHVAELEAEETRRREAEDAATRAAAWAGGPDRLLAAAEGAERAGDTNAAIEAYVGAAAGYAGRNQFDAALEACQRALGLSLGSPLVHLEMVRVYFQRGWTERAVERLVLLNRALTLQADPVADLGVRELARIHRDDDARLAALAGTGVRNPRDGLPSGARGVQA